MDNIVIPIIILCLILLLFVFASENSKKATKKRRSHLLSKLNDLEKQIENTDPIIRRDAVIRLDNLLSKAFQTRYNNNKTCGDNLKDAKRLFSKKLYQEIWDVHKMRNEIVHKDIDITQDEAKQAYKIYKISIQTVLR